MNASLMLTLLLGGACVGSFINVVVWRLPREESVVWPGSHCPHCGHAIRWHDNLPVLGWMILQGRCRDCHQPIAGRYPLVEALTAGIWLSAGWAMGLDAPSAAGLPATLTLGSGVVLGSLLLPLVLIDVDHLWLPEPLCRTGVFLGWMATALMVAFTALPTSTLLHHLIAAAAGLVILESLSALAERLVGQPALGLGDAKLAAVAGAWLGLAGLGMAMGIAVMTGALFGSIGRISGRLKPKQPFPFGPFIALGIWLVWLTGPQWWWQNWLTLLQF